MVRGTLTKDIMAMTRVEDRYTARRKSLMWSAEALVRRSVIYVEGLAGYLVQEVVIHHLHDR